MFKTIIKNFFISNRLMKVEIFLNKLYIFLELSRTKIALKNIIIKVFNFVDLIEISDVLIIPKNISISRNISK